MEEQFSAQPIEKSVEDWYNKDLGAATLLTSIPLGASNTKSVTLPS